MASFLATKMYPLAIYNPVADSSKPDLQVLRGPLIHLVVGSASASRSVISQLRKDLRDSCGYRPIPRFYDQLEDRLQFSCQAMFSSEEASSRRQFVLGCGAIFSCATFNSNCELVELPAWAGEESNVLDDKDGVLETMKSLFDPNEKTKSGKFLPKAYLKSAREVVKTLRESLKEDSKDIAKFRRTADAAKESIREYLNGWRGQKTVVNEESYVELEKAIRSLASFYSKAGPSATLPEEITSEILSDLNKAEEFL